ncbi:hypothetical protein EVAR_91437_1 [Eumeta japonica]|uniref:Uncharacterized protein n=1 Tax=Eumeta variegata TaxID=151549 RepID=A0A4C1X3G8_EUMVA|nr:hypothetical protein EVAR_91437_1 [Eumeta japonica]
MPTANDFTDECFNLSKSNRSPRDPEGACGADAGCSRRVCDDVREHPGRTASARGLHPSAGQKDRGRARCRRCRAAGMDGFKLVKEYRAVARAITPLHYTGRPMQAA